MQQLQTEEERKKSAPFYIFKNYAKKLEISKEMLEIKQRDYMQGNNTMTYAWR